MNNPLLNLQPNQLWKEFYQLTQIPHPSGHTARIRKYLLDFGNSNGLYTKEDEAGNVLIKKPAMPGKENLKTVILQAHMDMVPQKNSHIKHDFESDPLQVYVDGDWVKAKDTTLGADNGIGLAAILDVLLSKEINHGPIEALFTNDEEIGMHGVFGLQKEFLSGDILMNLDSEDEGELFVGCAGGIDADFTFHYTPVAIPDDDIAVKVSLKGLFGGHSGIDIHLERANANKLMFRFLKIAIAQFGARLAFVNGGSLRNAIPREAYAIITIPKEGFDELKELVEETNELFNEEFAKVEPQISFTCEQTDFPTGLLPVQVQDDLVNAIYAAPNGVYRHVPHMPEVVETSNNVAIVTTEENKITVKCLIRSSLESKKIELCSMLDSVFSLAGAKVEFLGGYPGWEPNFDSPILKTMKAIYRQKFDKAPQIKVIHAGLECGIIGATYTNLDMISFGPTIRFPHSPDEKVHIPSVSKFWDLLLAALENIPVKY